MDEVLQSLTKYNNWGSKPALPTPEPLGYRRSLYLDKVEKYLNNPLAKVLMGQRRTGKSYILRQIIQDLQKKVSPQNTFYLNKEFLEFDAIKSYQDLNTLVASYKKRYQPQGKIYYFFDEIQEVVGWEKIVNALTQNFTEPCEVFITGSNSKMLSTELSTYLSGRFVQFEVFPFVFNEYCNFTKLPKTKESYLKFLQTGGLPELFKLQDREVQVNYVSSLTDTILLNDIVKKFSVRDPALLGSLFKFVSDNIGNLSSPNTIVGFLKSAKVNTNYETVSNYLTYLSQALLIHEVDRFDIKGKALLTGAKKYYLNDLSFKNYLFSSFDVGLSKHLENAIYIYYRQQGYKVYVGTVGNLEVDFILEKSSDKKYVQVCYNLTDDKVISREFTPLESIKDNYEKIVVGLDDTSYGNKNGIKHLLAWEL
ncbi:AAA family ATPase [candidate division WWE3 bacterium CG08_land_8_20_14_0_20_41_10]|uniref:AAA family ATPase n=1 Tax=candidate division WWE3 bacterium CG08_land_8_20_14_0_20_41_10 TaxID=1975085 RepID=A0A2H0XCY0_UNCKA|nr:MAG: AAA family ATPase [candidate division WWE3 bacterium CG08_land_8_20_14_0_20_41_10]